MPQRIVQVTRNTSETQIHITLNINGNGKSEFNTGIPFLEHMLEQIAKHGAIDLKILAKGDLHIDDHHTVEDIGITLGQAFTKALGDKKGLRRYGQAYIPLDEALSRVVIDFSGRPILVSDVSYPDRNIGRFATTLVHEFFQGFCNHALTTLHIDNLRGANSHHIAETIFKAFGRAVKMAVEVDPKLIGIQSTKGVL